MQGKMNSLTLGTVLAVGSVLELHFPNEYFAYMVHQIRKWMEKW